jgi:anti-anti-sigma factor
MRHPDSEERNMLRIQQKPVENEGVTLLELAGRITIGRDCQELEWKMEELSAAGKRTIVIDMAQVTFIDSTGLGIFAMASGKLKSAGGRLLLAAPSPPVEQVFQLTRVNTILAIHTTLAEALAAATSSAAGA